MKRTKGSVRPLEINKLKTVQSQEVWGTVV